MAEEVVVIFRVGVSAGLWAGLLVATAVSKPASRTQEPWRPVCPAAGVRIRASRCRHPRRYPSDATNAEWVLIGLLLPAAAWRA
jgi:hypothetical protein